MIASILIVTGLTLASPVEAVVDPGHLPAWEAGTSWSYWVEHDVDFEISEDLVVNRIEENWTRVVHDILDVEGVVHYRVRESRRGTLSGTFKYLIFEIPVSAQATGTGWTIIRATDMAVVNQSFNLTFSAPLPMGLGELRGGFDNVTTYEPPMPMLEFPIPSTAWRARSTINTTTEFYVSSPFRRAEHYETSQHWDINVTATGPSPLTVAAGTYDSFAVHENGTRSNATNTWLVDRTWYYADRALNTVRSFEGHELVWTNAVYVPPNSPPVGPDGPIELTTEEDAALEIDLADHFSDPDGDDLQFTLQLEGDSASNASLKRVGDAWSLEPAGDWHGLLQLAAVASDPFDHSAEATLTVEVTPVNDPPHQVGSVPPARLDEDTHANGVYDLSLYFGDVDGDLLGYTAEVDQGAEVLINGTLVDVFPERDFVGHIQVTFRATDPSSEFAVQTAIIVVDPVNDPPYIGESGGPARVHEGEEGTFWAEAEDVDSDTLSYRWFVNGSGVQGHGEATFVYAPVDAGGSVVNVTLVVLDEWEASDTRTWNVTVLDSPVIVGVTPGADVSALVGDTVVFSMVVEDADTPEPDFEWTWNGDLVGTGIELQMDFRTEDVGEGTLVARVSDGVGSDQRSWTVTVSVPNLPPTVSISSPQNGSVHRVGDVLVFTAEVDDEDLTSLEVRWSVDDSPAGSGTEVSYKASVEGTLLVRVTVSDGEHQVSDFVTITTEVKDVDGGTQEASWAGWLVIALLVGALAIVLALVLRRRRGPPG